VSDTPFIDSLSSQDRDRVQKKSLGDRRPFYLNPTTQAQTQISLDLEALLILLDAVVKRRLISFANASAAYVPDSSELELMAEVVSIRRDNYTVQNRELTQPLKQYDVTKAKVVASMEQFVRNGNPITNPTTTTTESNAINSVGAAFIVDLGTMFQSFAGGYNSILRSDDCAIHDRTTDQMTLFFFQGNDDTRKAQIASWVSVINTYL
jgi:hypothetical protein